MNVAAPFLLALVLTLLLARPGLAALGWLKVGQYIREEGPQSHHAKAGTPSMGGWIFVLAALAATLPYMQPDPMVLTAMATLVAFAILGFTDDILGRKQARNRGLGVKQKLAFQVILGIVFATTLWSIGHETWVLVPFFHIPWSMGPAYWPLLVFLLVGFSNATNLTDGLDGLCATTMAIAMGGLALLVARWGQPALHPGILSFAIAICGACVGFLWLNAHPAQVFMGDTGSMALGAAFTAVAAIAHLELYLVPLGAIFVAEALSVMLQVGYFKATGGKRIFLMSPLHHHFELGGLHESKIVTRFALAGIIAAAFTLVWL